MLTLCKQIGVFIPKAQAIRIIEVLASHMTELELAAALEEAELICEQNGWTNPASSPEVRVFRPRLGSRRQVGGR